MSLPETTAAKAASRSEGDRATHRVTASPRKLVPIKWWATVGAAILAVGACSMARWLLSGAEANTIGRAEVPDFMRLAGIVWQSGGIVTTLGLLWWFLVRPLRRDGRLSFDGLLLLALLTMYWQDMLSNATQWWAVYNTTLVNLGSWYGFVPLWNAPGAAHYPEPFLLSGPMYVYGIFPPVLAANRLMRHIRAKHPRVGTLGLAFAGFSALVVADVLLEPLLLVLGLWSYPGAVQALSIFAGTHYQFPIYEALLWGLVWTSIACLRFFRNERGESFAERGLSRLSLGRRSRTVIRFLALAGVVNLSYLLLHHLPYQAISMRADAWPRDVIERPYLTGGLCGPGTDYACPGPDTPLARRGARHLGPDGTVRPAVADE